MGNGTKNGKFNWRGFTSLVVTVGFLIMVVTGVVLYLSPRGRIANWTGWEMLGLAKDEWAGLHINIAIILLAASVLHLIYNWKPFVSYLRSRAGKINAMRREAGLAAVILLATGMFSFFEIAPFGTVLAWQQQIKDYWEQTPLAPAPYPHADETPLDRFSAETGYELEAVLTSLKSNGLKVPDVKLTIGQIAERNGLVPAAVYEAIRSNLGAGVKQTHSPGATAGGQGRGFMTLAEVCGPAGLDLARVLDALKARGIDAAGETRLFEIAQSLGTQPGQVLQELKLLAS